MASIKILRLQKELKKMFNTAVLYSLRDDRLKGVYFSDVEISPDLRQAKVFFYDSSSDLSHEELEACLTRASGQFKKSIGDAKMMRVIPELRFSYDSSQEQSSRIETLLSAISSDEDGNEEDDEDYEDDEEYGDDEDYEDDDDDDEQ
ncbi:MAG: 30S ribosome-binding factor RbfA [Candidatus Cloacimonadales bacterium]